MEFLRQAWNAAFASPTPPALWIAALCVIAGSIPAFIPAIWKPARHVVTLAHEGGHAVIGVLTGRKLNGIKLHTDTSGVTATSGASWGMSGLLSTLAGYPAPAAVGSLIIFGVMIGRSDLTAAIACCILIILLLFTRNLWGIVVTSAAILGLGASFLYAPQTLNQIILLLLAGFLASGSFVTLIEERRGRLNGQPGSDISALAENTSIPAGAWWVLSIIISAAWVIGAVVLTIR